MKRKTIKHFVIAVTGGIACGKSEVLKRLAARRIPVLSADDLAHACTAKGTPAFQSIIRHFGQSVVMPDGTLDRQTLGAIVFKKPAQRRRLEKMVHPCVVRGIKRFINQHSGLIALDIPLLFEAGLDRFADMTVCVSCTQAEQVSRLKKRNGLSSADAQRRIVAQMPLARKRRLSDYVIDNSGRLSELDGKIVDLMTAVKKLLTSITR